MEAFETQGYWWLPANPDTRVPGRLTVTAEGRAELSLIGALDSYLSGGESTTDENGVTTTSFTEESMERSGVYPRILGIGDSGNFTLQDCIQSQRHLGTIETQRVTVSQVLRGVHFDPDGALKFQRLTAEMNWLPFWVARSGLEESYRFAKKDGRDQIDAVDLRLAPLDTQTCAGQDGATVSLSQGFSISGNRVTERRMGQSFSFSIETSGLTSLEALLEQMSDLQDLVSIGTGKHAGYSTLTLQHPEVRLPAMPGEFGPPASIELIGRWRVVSQEGPENLNWHDMFFTLADLGGMEGVERWLAVAAAHRSELGRVMATKCSPSMYQSDKVLNCTAALEAYDRSTHKEDYLVDRLKRLAAAAGDVFDELVGDVPAFATALKTARHDVAHHKTGMVTASSGHIFLGMSAYWLFAMCLLREGQAPDGVFEHIKQHPEFRWLSRRMREQFDQPQ